MAKGTTLPIEIELASGTPHERLAETQLRGLMARYDLDALIITKHVRIQSRAVPHSHPILTLNTRHLDDDERQLAVFVHEQLHWYAVRHEDAVADAMAELRVLYPEVPVGGDQGGRNEDSSYLHLVVCLWELDALANLVGKERARAIVDRADVYRWIYAKALHEASGIREIMTRHELALPTADSG